MNNTTYLYHYFPLYDICKLEGGDENKTIENLMLDENLKETQLRRCIEYLEYLNLLIKEKKLHISQCGSLNDPFEFIAWIQPDVLLRRGGYEAYQKSNEYEKNPLKQNEWYDSILKSSEKNNGLIPFNPLGYNPITEKKYYGIVCFSGSGNNPLMWSYYANGHAGVCIRFKINEKMKNVVQSERKVEIIFYDNGPNFLFGKICYAARPLMLDIHGYDYYSNYHSKLLEKNPGLSSDKIGIYDLISTDIILGKGNNWTHEEECRLIALGLEKEIYLPNLRDPKTKEHLLMPDAIIFGLKTPDSAKKLIQNSFGNGILYCDSYIDSGTYDLKHTNGY